MTPLDLSKARPRPPRATVAGVTFLPRTIDKIRASLPGGNPGEYAIAGLSQKMFEMLGLAEQDFHKTVVAAKSDDDVAAWVSEHAKPGSLQAWNAWLLAREVTPESHERLAKRYPCYARDPSITKLVDILETDDREVLGEPLAVSGGR